MTRSTPSIHISQHTTNLRQASSDQSSLPRQASSPLAAMAIPHAREPVPPPLPPPQYIPEINSGYDLGWQLGNDPRSSDYGRSATVKPGSSLLGGGFYKSPILQEKDEDRKSEHIRRTSSTSTITPPSREVEREVVMENTDDAHRQLSNGFRSEQKLERSTFEGLSHAYDKALLNRIGGPSTPGKSSLSGSNIQDITERERERRNSLLPALGSSQEGTRWLPSMSPSGKLGAQTWDMPNHTRHSSTHSDLSRSVSIEQQPQEDFPMDDARPAEQDPFAIFRIGAKRRASSPPRDLPDRSPISSIPRITEAQRRAAQAASSPRFAASHASYSSASSFGGHRHGSLSSSLGPSSMPSSATSYASGVLSPLATSTTLDSDMASDRADAMSVTSTTHQRVASEAVIEQKPAGHSREGSRSLISGMYVCECCPKKPKRYDTESELKAHEAEKAYGCAWCSNRFKNKNEAERHQNSLHLRRHSWSCAALAGREAAFHSSTTGNNTDTCGYCGEEFANPPEWKERMLHLTNNHKFGQCNQTKKFFRADHFRQHLKHSHDSTSGKWTNMLENACMKDEPPVPPKQAMSDAASPLNTSSDYTNQRA